MDVLKLITVGRVLQVLQVGLIYFNHWWNQNKIMKLINYYSVFGYGSNTKTRCEK